MHAYRDAIRRTGGAYVLYPGTEKKEFKGFHEIVPGLGAFAVNPSQEKIGIQNISEFIDNVVKNLLDRSSQREQIASKIYSIHEKPKSDQLHEAFPEFIHNKKVIPDEAAVIIGYYKSRKHLDWILEKKLYNFRSGTRQGSIMMTPSNIGAKFLVLYGKGEVPTSKVFSLSASGPRIFSADDLDNYPNPGGKLYLVYQIENDLSTEFDHSIFDLNKISGFKDAPLKYGPLTCTLTELFYSKVSPIINDSNG